MKKHKAHIRYKTKDGKVVPGTTTITGLRAKPFLITWANKLGLEGVDSSKYSDERMLIGTIVHEMVLAHFNGQILAECLHEDYSDYQIDQAENAFLSFLEWVKQHNIKPIIVEEPLVSETFLYGGTPDLYAEIDGKMVLTDFKSGKALYDDMPWQLAAYAQLLREAGHKIDEAWIVRIGTKEDEGFEVRVYKDLEKQWRIFKNLLEIYYLEKELK